MQANMVSLAIVPVIVWFGVFLYLFTIDRKLARLEVALQESDL